MNFSFMSNLCTFHNPYSFTFNGYFMQKKNFDATFIENAPDGLYSSIVMGTFFGGETFQQ